MSIALSVAEVLRDHVVLEVEAIDRMYCVDDGGDAMTEAFVRNIAQFVNHEGVVPRDNQGETAHCRA
jgi:hypothetical protein